MIQTAVVFSPFLHAGLEFAYSQAPNTMHSVCMGLFYGVVGMGMFFSLVLVKIVCDVGSHLYYIDSEKSFGSVHYFFAVLLGCLLASLIVYTLVSRWFKGIVRRGYFESG